MSAPASLTSIAASASSAPRGGKVTLVPQITGGVSTINGVDDQSNPVKVTVSEQVTITVASAAPTSNPPKGTFVFWSDNPADLLTVNPDGTLTLVKG